AVKQWKQLKRLASRSLSVRGLDCTVGYGAFLLRIEIVLDSSIMEEKQSQRQLLLISILLQLL
ncbi:unnamed protein product, partial [Prunus armeniaca]